MCLVRLARANFTQMARYNKIVCKLTQCNTHQLTFKMMIVQNNP